MSGGICVELDEDAALVLRASVEFSRAALAFNQGSRATAFFVAPREVQFSIVVTVVPIVFNLLQEGLTG